MGFSKLRLVPSAEAEIQAIPFPLRRQVNQRIMRLGHEPFPAEAERYSETDDFRLFCHGWSILFSLDESAGIITIWAVRKL